MQSSVDDLNRTRMDRTRMMLQHAISLMSRPMARRHYELPPGDWSTTLDGRASEPEENIDTQIRARILAECKRNDRAERRARDRAKDAESRAVIREFGPSLGRHLIRSAGRYNMSLSATDVGGNSPDAVL